MAKPAKSTPVPTQNESDSVAPLADRLRPQNLDQVVGQEHIVGRDKFLRSVIERGAPVSMILWGPPGSGKTTLARIIARSGDFEFHEISAVTSGLADVKKIITQAKNDLAAGRHTVLFVDEIHRFNKAQQDAFLPHVEAGTLTLIGATTENPSFEVIGPLLSRSRVVVLEPLSHEQIIEIIRRAITETGTKNISADAIDVLAELSGGDARMALNGLETAARIRRRGTKIGVETIKQAMQQLSLHYDKTGEYHYNLISAFIKSMRGGAVDAALYYMTRMLQSGDDPKFIARRMVVFASEDIGIASPGALNLAVSTFLAVERVGMPECQYALYQCAITLARSRKNRSVADAIGASFEAVRQYPTAPVPLHLRNAPTKLMKELGYGKDYKWRAGFEHAEGFLPEELGDVRIYREESSEG